MLSPESNRLSILHLTTFLQGGAGRVICDLALRQKKDGHNVWVGTSHSGPEGYGNYPAYLVQLRNAGVGVIEADSFFKRELHWILRAMGTVAEGLRDVPLDLVHAHAACPALAGLLLRSVRKSHFPVLQTMHGWGLVKTPEMAETDLHIMSHLDRVIAVARAGETLLTQKGLEPGKITVIYNGIATEKARFIGEEATQNLLRQKRALGGKIIGCIGTIGYRKNQALLYETFAALCQSRPDLLLVLVGEGEGLDELRRRAHSSGLSDKVIFTGYSQTGAAYLPFFDLLVLPSRNEGLPITVLEAFREEVLVAASAIPEHEELLEGGRLGLLFAAEDREDLAEAIVMGLDMPVARRQRIIESAAATFCRCYSIDRMAAAYYAVYLETLFGAVEQ